LKTHAFKLGKYKILWFTIEACCDTPSKPNEQMALMTPEVVDYHTFCLAAHEAEHADGLPDRLIHDEDGCPDHGGRHRFMWRIFKMMQSKGVKL